MVKQSIISRRNWKYNIGDNIKDKNRDMYITNKFLKEYTYQKNGKQHIGYYMYYNYNCNICGYKNGEISQSNLNKGVKCSCCSNRTIVKGINDLGTIHPELKKYFLDDREYLYSEKSGQYDYFKCPDCGDIKKMSISNLVSNGFYCDNCSDGVSYPEKFITSLLKQLNINFIHQLSKKDYEWCGYYKYDFYLPDYNAIIEVHGDQHYNKCFTTSNSLTLEEQKERDIIKEKLAKENNISYYIIIDAKYSNLEYIKNSIINNKKLKDIINVSIVNFEECNEYALNNLVKSVCDFWNKNDNLSSNELCKIFNVSSTAILKYLHIGTKLGWCNYNKEEQIKKYGKRRCGENHHFYNKHLSDEHKTKLLDGKAKTIREKNEKIIICQYDLEEQLLNIYNANEIKELGFRLDIIKECCRGTRKTYKNYKWSYYHDNPNIYISAYHKKSYKNNRNKSGVTGVFKLKTCNSWVAYIYVNHKRIHLGSFKTEEDAIKARKEAEIKYYN